jgi:A/G-specific adenine glycosylase
METGSLFDDIESSHEMLPPPLTPRAELIAPALLDWFDTAGRKHLPWQQNTTAYRVWVSEVMLQQTQVATVIPYYERFMQRFATIESLAAASVDEVLHLWTGLGYYARGRNLHRAAQIIVERFAGEFPVTFDAVHELPGIGRSTAGAILSLACRQRHPILDGNVKRVLTRYFGIDGFPGEPRIEQQLWLRAEEATPHSRVAHYTQAIMDLGATLCTRSRPHCIACPLMQTCAAHLTGRQSQLPTPRPKRLRPHRETFALVLLREDDALLLEQRPPTGIWGGLWSFPQFETQADALRWCEHGGIASAQIDSLQQLPTLSHGFTHYDLDIKPLLIRCTAGRASLHEIDRHCWYRVAAPAKIGLTKPAVELIRICSGFARHADA